MKMWKKVVKIHKNHKTSPTGSWLTRWAEKKRKISQITSSQAQLDRDKCLPFSKTLINFVSFEISHCGWGQRGQRRRWHEKQRGKNPRERQAHKRLLAVWRMGKARRLEMDDCGNWRDSGGVFKVLRDFGKKRRIYESFWTYFFSFTDFFQILRNFSKILRKFSKALLEITKRLRIFFEIIG